MKLEIDTKLKTIKVLEAVPIQELLSTLSDLLGRKSKEYHVNPGFTNSMETSSKIINKN